MVADILRQAGLRLLFYRHFDSKDQLLCSLFRRESEVALTRLDAKVSAASDRRAALNAWIAEILSFGHHPTNAAGVTVLGSPAALKATGYAEELRRCRSPGDGVPSYSPCPWGSRWLVPLGRPGRRRAVDPIGGFGRRWLGSFAENIRVHGYRGSPGALLLRARLRRCPAGMRTGPRQARPSAEPGGIVRQNELMDRGAPAEPTTPFAIEDANI